MLIAIENDGAATLIDSDYEALDNASRFCNGFAFECKFRCKLERIL